MARWTNSLSQPPDDRSAATSDFETPQAWLHELVQPRKGGRVAESFEGAETRAFRLVLRVTSEICLLRHPGVPHGESSSAAHEMVAPRARSCPISTEAGPCDRGVATRLP